MLPRGGIKDGGMQTGCAEKQSGEGPPPNPASSSQPSPHQRGRERKRKGQQSSQLSEFRIYVEDGGESQEDSDHLQGRQAWVSLRFARPWPGSQCQGAVAEERRRICFEQ